MSISPLFRWPNSVCHFTPEGEIDFTWSERYQLSKDSMT
ncbi:RecE family exodeoxyribonuclease, partial [Shigella flexneri]